ncbi:hypothetical protein [Streptomyces sp. NPDC002403]
MLNDDEVLKAVQNEIKGRGETLSVTPPGAAAITWHPLLEGKIVRCLESRTEHERFHAGPLDLSNLPAYDTTISRRRIPPPRDPSKQSTLKLVRRGSVDDRSCDCGNGSIACQRCKGAGDLPCEPYRPCAECRGLDSCLRCVGTGFPNPKPAGPAAQDTDGRVQCRQCGAHDAACAGCHGRGQLQCSTCKATGSRSCPDCDGDGTVQHQHCAGTGRTVTWTEGVVTRTPSAGDVKLPEHGVPYLARQQVRERGTWAPTNLTDNDPLRDHLTKEFGPSLKTLLLPHDQEIARQATAGYTRLARVVVAGHPHRVYFVFPASGGPHVLVLPSQRRTWQITAIVLGVLVLLALIARLAV